jgi:hypothetical protein
MAVMKATVLSRVQQSHRREPNTIPDPPMKTNRTVDQVVQDDWEYNAAEGGPCEVIKILIREKGTWKPLEPANAIPITRDRFALK